MRIVLTLLARDEADIVDECIRYHLANGVDFVIATDHASVDGTADILASYERAGQLRLLRQDDAEIRQSEWVTAMARLAASDYGADWVINTDADEFWWPRSGTIRGVLAAVPSRFGAVRGLMRHFIPRPGVGPFYERMVVRHACDPDPHALFLSQVKVAHRSRPDVTVSSGNHDAYGEGLALLREWFPIEVLHFPVRSVPQMRAKFSRRTDTPGKSAMAMQAAIAALGVEKVFDSLCVADDRLPNEIARRSVAVDLRLRAALQQDSPPPVRLPPGVSPESPLEADRAFLADVASFMETDSAVRERRRLDAIESRVRGAGMVWSLLGRSSRRRTAAALRAGG